MRMKQDVVCAAAESYYAETCFYYFAHPMYISEGRLNYYCVFVPFCRCSNQFWQVLNVEMILLTLNSPVIFRHFRSQL